MSSVNQMTENFFPGMKIVSVVPSSSKDRDDDGIRIKHMVNSNDDGIRIKHMVKNESNNDQSYLDRIINVVQSYFFNQE